MSAQTSGPAAGFFGKLPERGDFLCRRLPPELVRGWDSWLQAGLAECRDRLGERWIELFLVGPVWRFVLCSEPAVGMPWAGVLIPSVDRVGRYFPLTLVASLPEPSNPFTIADDCAWWLDRLEDLALDALEGTLSVEQLDAELIALGGMASVDCEHEESSERPSGGGRGWRLEISEPRSLISVLPRSLHRALTEHFGGYSLWWTDGSAHLPASVLVHAGLPAKSAFPSLYSGDWASGHWVDLGKGFGR